MEQCAHPGDRMKDVRRVSHRGVERQREQDDDGRAAQRPMSAEMVFRSTAAATASASRSYRAVARSP
jgi:hypothetical protein